MKYQEINGDLFTAKQGALLHGCNAQGVMGSGVAKIVRYKWPFVYEAYKRWCDPYIGSKELLGSFMAVGVDTDFMVINAVTQQYYGTDRRHVDYEAVAEVFETLEAAEAPYNLIHMPMIGAGYGGGNWNIIRTIIQETLKDTDFDVRVYYL